MAKARTNPKATPQPRSRRRRWLFRLVAVLVGLSPIIICECGLRILGLGYPDESNDPYVGFNEVHPLFVPDGNRQRYRISPSRITFFRPDSFPIIKGGDTYRVFCLGGSTVQGRPYAIETSFTSWLRLNLEAADKTRTWEVVNCGGISYASYRLVPILKEVLTHQPDMIVVYTGHNEFLEDRTYADVKAVSPFIQKSHRWLSKWRTYHFVRGLIRRPAPTAKETLPAEVEARLDYWGGLEDYHRDAKWRDSVVQHYNLNLRRMVSLCRTAKVPIVFVDPVANVRDSAPFKSQAGDGLSSEAVDLLVERWNELQGQQLPLDELVEKLEALQVQDPQHAGIAFHLGKCYEAQRDWDKARAAFHQALIEDVCPLRMLPQMHDVLHQVCRDTSTSLIDVRTRFEQASPGRILGDEVFVDHVHPSIEGHQWIAEEIMKHFISTGVVKPSDDWKQRRKQLYANNFRDLDQMYFVRAKERLEGLQIWTKGKVPLHRKSQPEKKARSK